MSGTMLSFSLFFFHAHRSCGLMRPANQIWRRKYPSQAPFVPCHARLLSSKTHNDEQGNDKRKLMSPFPRRSPCLLVRCRRELAPSKKWFCLKWDVHNLWGRCYGVFFVRLSKKCSLQILEANWYLKRTKTLRTHRHAAGFVRGFSVSRIMVL